MIDKNWKIENTDLESAQNLIDGVLSKMDIPSFAQVSWEANELCVRLEKGGKSEFRLIFKPQGSSIHVSTGSKQVALFHKPFVGNVETFVSQVFRQAGAKEA